MSAIQNFLNIRGSRAYRRVNDCLPTHKTYYFQGDEVYTEDNILVKKLFLYKIAPGLSPKQLRAYFNTFGRVEHLHLFGKATNHFASKASNDRPKTKSGFVVFADPRSAAKALRRKFHNVNKERLSVQPSDSWHQPDANGIPRKQLSSDPNEPPAAILNLNDHCLDYIVRLLALPDRIHFARTCIRFREIYKQASPALDKCVKFEEFADMTMWDVRDFFVLSGRHVRKIEGIIPQRHRQRLGEFLGAHCTNLTTMRITANKLTIRTMYKIFGKLTQLESLQLRGCDLRNDALLALKHLSQLKILDLSNNDKLTGQNMNRLPTSIESLTLTSCTGLQSKLLPRVFKALKQLKELHIKGVYTIGSGFKQLVNSQRSNTLETISVSNGLCFGLTNQYEHIAKLPSLKKLTIHSHEENAKLRPDLLTWLVEHRSEQLVHFETRGQNCINSEMVSQISKLRALRTLIVPNNDAIKDREMEALSSLHELEEINLKYCCNVNNNTVLRLILSCPKLRVLHLENCPQLTVKLLSDIIFKMRLQIRQKEIQRQLPIKLSLYGCNINEVNMQNPDVVSKDIIDASFVPPSSSDLCFFDLSDLLVFDDDMYFGSDELNTEHDHRLYDMGFLSDDDDDFDFSDDYDDYDGDFDELDGFDEFGYDLEDMDYSDIEDYWDSL
ncbi:uncharacterized protein LOC135426817 [Drosophila montana]|uniref:uncharacterized protein LOC135426817 n=1 Tax=Drosophila montana TaxID=40370 RepID=UPI00313B0F74